MWTSKQITTERRAIPDRMLAGLSWMVRVCESPCLRKQFCTAKAQAQAPLYEQEHSRGAAQTEPPSAQEQRLSATRGNPHVRIQSEAHCKCLCAQSAGRPQTLDSSKACERGGGGEQQEGERTGWSQESWG